MALSNMQVFIDSARTMVIEKIGQQIEKFNSASNNTIQLSADGFSGDFFERSFYNSLVSAKRRVDRYAANSDVPTTDLSQSKTVAVKVAGGFGPVLFEPAQLAWIEANPAEAMVVISTSMTEAIMEDMINTALTGLVGAIGNNADAVNDASSVEPDQAGLNNTDVKFGDSSQFLVARFMTGATYHALIGKNLTNAENLYQAGNVRVVDILGKVAVVTDSPALIEAGKQKVLTLVSGAMKIGNTKNLVMNTSTTNGKQRIETTYQADYDFTMEMKGYSWNIENGGKSPTDADIATGTNWDMVVNDVKHTAGVLTIFKV